MISRALLSLLGCLALSAGCGVGDEIVLGATSAGHGGSGGAAGGPDAAAADGSHDAGSDASIDGSDVDSAVDAAADHDAGPDAGSDAGPPGCKETFVSTVPPQCSYAARSTVSAVYAKWRWPAADLADALTPVTGLVPLVANLTDDNRDSAIDGCDVPDVVVVAFSPNTGSGELVLLSGDTGLPHFSFDAAINTDVNPALADLDGDRVAEVVAIDETGSLIIFDHTGQTRFNGDAPAWLQTGAGRCHAIAIADLEADGAPEILAGFDVYDAHGRHRFGAPPPTTLPWPFPQNPAPCTAPIAADLDRDGQLEVLFGSETYDASGQLLWSVPGEPALPHALNLDADPELEVVLSRPDGVFVVEDMGATQAGPLLCGNAPLALFDTTGDDRAELLDGVCSVLPYAWVNLELQATWSRAPAFLTGNDGVAGFDFHARGRLDPIVSESGASYVLDAIGGSLVASSNAGSTSTLAFPVVADVDSDRSADILVIDDSGNPTLYALSAVDHSWPATRRIFNQLTYSITNVHEDGTLPTLAEQRALVPWSFHANALTDRGSICHAR